MGISHRVILRDSRLTDFRECWKSIPASSTTDVSGKLGSRYPITKHAVDRKARIPPFGEYFKSATVRRLYINSTKIGQNSAAVTVLNRVDPTRLGGVDASFFVTRMPV